MLSGLALKRARSMSKACFVWPYKRYFSLNQRRYVSTVCAYVKSCGLPCRAGLTSPSLISTNARAWSRHISPDFSNCSANQVTSMDSVKFAWATPSASFSRPSCRNFSAISLCRPTLRYSSSKSSSLKSSACLSVARKSMILRLCHLLEKSCPGLIS